MYHSSDRIPHTTAFVTTSRGALAGTRNSSMDPPHEGSIRRPIEPWANALSTELHLAPLRALINTCFPEYTRLTLDVRALKNTCFPEYTRSTLDVRALKNTVEHWLELEIAQCVHQEWSILRPIAPWANTLNTELHLVSSPYDITDPRNPSFESFIIIIISSSSSSSSN